MLNRLILEHFKCFDNLEIPLANLTLLTGFNSSGKSSLLQALALLHQTMRDNEWSQNLLLDGSCLSLGTAGDVINQNHSRDLGIGIEWDQERCLWRFESTDRRAFSIPLKSVEYHKDAEIFNQEISQDTTQAFQLLLPNDWGMKYLSLQKAVASF